MRVVTPFRPFAAESIEHQRLGPFDWPAAIEMLRASVACSCHVDTIVITDVDTAIAPAFRYHTTERRLMLWILEVIGAYLRSTDFDQDTIMVSPDTLVQADLAPVFAERADLAVLVRTAEVFRGTRKAILNGTQWWRHAAKPELIEFYDRALTIARDLPEELLRWGADTEPLRMLLEPIELGIHVRRRHRRERGMRIKMIEARHISASLSDENVDRCTRGHRPRLQKIPILDFKYTRKRHMAAYAAMLAERAQGDTL